MLPLCSLEKYLVKFTEVKHDPQSDAWFEWRKGGVGSSDASIIMGVSRFKTIDQLRAEKATGFKQPETGDNFARERGHKVEEFVREQLQVMHQTTYAAMNCISSVFPFMRASLDGITPDLVTITEIKFLTVFNPAKPNVETAGYKKWVGVKENGVIPDEYYPQVQHQLFITGAKSCLFAGFKDVRGQQWSSDDIAIATITPDKDYMRELARREFEFMYSVQELREEIAVQI